MSPILFLEFLQSFFKIHWNQSKKILLFHFFFCYGVIEIVFVDLIFVVYILFICYDFFHTIYCFLHSIDAYIVLLLAYSNDFA